MDALKYQLQLALEETKRTREQNEFLHKELADRTSDCHKMQLHIDFLERRNQLLEGLARGNLNLEYLAEIAPAVFEQIAHNLDRSSVYCMLRTNRFLRSKMQTMMKAKKLENKILPYRNTNLVINGALWVLGFNNIHFYGYLAKAAFEDKTDIVTTKKVVGGSSDIKMKDLANSLMGFAPKKIVFNIKRNDDFLERHLHFLNRIQVAPGTTTEIWGGDDRDIQLITATTKPIELILLNSRIHVDFEEDVFMDDCFESVEHLRIRDMLTDGFFRAQRFNIEPLSERLVSFEFTGSIPEYPGTEVNSLLQKWVAGKSPLREVKIVTDSIAVEPVLQRVLAGIRTTTASRLDQLPDFMQKKVHEDLVGLDLSTVDIAYRLFVSPKKEQMGLLYYSNSIDSSEYNTAIRAKSYLGFFAFDFYPVKRD